MANEELWLRRSCYFYGEIAEKWPMKEESDSVGKNAVLCFEARGQL